MAGSRFERALGRLRGRLSPQGPTPEPTLSAEQEAAFDASALPEALVERTGQETIGVSAPPSPLPIGAGQEETRPPVGEETRPAGEEAIQPPWDETIRPAGAGVGEPAAASAEVPPTAVASADPAAASPLSVRVHDWLPLAIVAVSVLAAIMGWRASLAEEHAGHSDELARQDLVTQQEVLLQKVQGVDSDIRLFGTFEQYSVLGHRLLAESASVGGAEGQSLARQGQGDLEIAREIGGQFRYISDYYPSSPSNYYSKSNTVGSLQADGSYRPGNPYRIDIAIPGAQSGDTQLTSLEPDRLRSQAKALRLQGVRLIGLAALFIAGLVFFTLSAVSRDLRTVSLAACGVAVALIGLILFPIVQLS